MNAFVKKTETLCTFRSLAPFPFLLSVYTYTFDYCIYLQLYVYYYTLLYCILFHVFVYTYFAHVVFAYVFVKSNYFCLPVCKRVMCCVLTHYVC